MAGGVRVAGGGDPTGGGDANGLAAFFVGDEMGRELIETADEGGGSDGRVNDDEGWGGDFEAGGGEDGWGAGEDGFEAVGG